MLMLTLTAKGSLLGKDPYEYIYTDMPAMSADPITLVHLRVCSTLVGLDSAFDRLLAAQVSLPFSFFFSWVGEDTVGTFIGFFPLSKVIERKRSCRQKYRKTRLETSGAHANSVHKVVCSKMLAN